MAIIDTIGSRGMLPTRRRLPRSPLEKPFGTPLTKISDGQEQPPALTPAEQPPGVSVRPLPGKPSGLSPRRIAEIQAKVGAGQMSMDDALNEINATNISPSPSTPVIQSPGKPPKSTLTPPYSAPYSASTAQPAPAPPASPGPLTRQQLEHAQWEEQWAANPADAYGPEGPEPGASLPGTFWQSQPPGTQERFQRASRPEKAFFVENGRLPTDVTELNIWLGRKGKPLVSVPATPTPGIPPAPAPAPTEQLVTAAKPPAAFQPAETLPQSPITFKGITVPPNQELEQPPDLTSWADQYESPEGTTAKPPLMSEVERLLQERIGSSVDEDPRYLSQLSDLTKQQTLRREQRKRDLIGLGIVKGDGSDFAAFDTLGEQDTREQQNLRANIENLRQQDIQSSLTRLSQQEQERQARAQEGLAAGGLTGKYGSTLTEEARRNRAQEALTVGAATGAMPLMNLDGTPAIDPATGRQRTGTTLNAQRLGLQTQELYGGTAPPVEFSRNDFIVAMGKKTGEPGYNPAFDIDRDGTITETDISIVGADAKDLGGGRFSYSPAGSRTLAARTQGAQLGIQEREQSLNEERTYGGHMETGPDGTQKWVGTLDYQQMTAEQKFKYATLTEDTRRTRVQERMQLAAQLGYTTPAGKLPYEDFVEAFKASEGGQPFDPAFDFDGDGKVTQNDLQEGRDSLAKPGETVSTLAAREVNARIKNAADALGLDRDRFNDDVRRFNVDTTAKYAAFMTEQEGIIYDPATNQPVSKEIEEPYGPPQTISVKDAAVAITRIAGVTSTGGVIRAGDENYVAYLDVNSDGQIDREDMDSLPTKMKELSSQARIAAGLTDPARYLSGLYSGTEKGGKGFEKSNVYISIQPTRTTKKPLSTQEAQKYRDSRDQWEREFNESVTKWMEQMDISYYGLQRMDKGQKSALMGSLIGTIISAIPAGISAARKKKE